MADLEHLNILQHGAEVWNHWRAKNEIIRPNLKGADLVGKALTWMNLSGADLLGADLRRANVCAANLGEANLSGADLTKANFGEADLSGANLGGADLDMVNFVAANLGGADLSGANLVGTNFSGANLWGANLNRAILRATTFADVDLSTTKGLERCVHTGPSSLGIDTLFKSQRKIPDLFLQGCGVPEQVIVYADSLIRKPIEFYSCFISHSSQDQAFAERLHANLRSQNIRCWLASEDLKIGDRFQEQIEKSISLSDKVIIVLSDASVKSRWVESEVNAAREIEGRQDRIVLFPIQIDDAVITTSRPWAADIRRLRHIGDFRKWKENASYEKAFSRLLRDLKNIPNHTGYTDIVLGLLTG